MDLTTYAELAVRLANTAAYSEDNTDRLTTMDGLRDLVADRQHLNAGNRSDLEALRGLRSEFRKIFVACAAGNGEEAAARLNALLMQHPVHPQLSTHDGQPWHVHFTDSGSVADKYAAGAAMGLAVRITELGVERFGVCQAPPCLGVFIDTSTNRSRRYCSERCVSRANVTAFRARKRGDGAGPAGQNTDDLDEAGTP
ncbi:MAG TPA: CGNR zinc finger domain-containing protein [Streptosporangiaceae bacterium]